MSKIPLAITTDYLKDDDDPCPYLQKIAEAGFTHVHWGHQWNTDTIYLDSDIDQINHWLHAFNLQVYGVHGSTGRLRCWYSANENQRLAGVELVKNRIRLAGRTHCAVVIMHISMGPQLDEARQVFLDQLYRSLDDIKPYATHFGVRIAIENEVDWLQLAKIKAAGSGGEIHLADNFELISRVLADYEPDYLGLCYDSGHGNIGRDRSDRLVGLSQRLIAVHLHDNNGSGDQHQLPFTGNVNWPEVTRLIATSSHSKTLCLESNLSLSSAKDETQFLKLAHEVGLALTRMVAAHSQMGVRE